MADPISTEAFNLIAAKLEAAKEDTIRRLNADLFSVEAMASRVTYPPVPRWKLRWWRVREYFSILWDAICGRDPYEPDDY